MQPDAFADMVVHTVKSALGPVLERLAAAEARLSVLPATDKTVAELRDRVVAVETKAAAVPAAVDIPDLAPVLERVAAAEARIAMLPASDKALADIRDRVVTVETKASLPQQDAAIGDLREKISALSEWRSVVTSLPIQVSALSDMVAKELADLRARLGAVETSDFPESGVDLGPIGERVAATEARLSVLGDLRDRVVAVETKAAVPLAPDAAIGELRDRILTIETKSAMPTVVDHALTEMKSRLTVLESREVVAPPVGGEDLRDRLVTLETRAAGPSLTDMAVVDLRERLASVERRVSDDQVTKDIAAIRERVAVVEVKAPVLGPQGKDGENGKDGVDGLGFDDVLVEHDGERSFTFKYARGERVKNAGTFTVPLIIYRGPFTDGRKYEPGDAVSWAGSTWHCKKQTSLKPDSVERDPRTGEPLGLQGHDFWVMMVKGGREGKPGRDGRDSLPPAVVSVGSRQ